MKDNYKSCGVIPTYELCKVELVGREGYEESALSIIGMVVDFTAIPHEVVLEFSDIGASEHAQMERQIEVEFRFRGEICEDSMKKATDRGFSKRGEKK